MFNEKDFDNVKRMGDEFPDGLVDGSDSHMILENITKILAETDYTTSEGRMEMMMNCINCCYELNDNDELEMIDENVFGVILGLTFNYSNIMSNLQDGGFDSEHYYNHLINELMPVMREESKNLPYWEMDDDNG